MCLCMCGWGTGHPLSLLRGHICCDFMTGYASSVLRLWIWPPCLACHVGSGWTHPHACVASWLRYLTSQSDSEARFTVLQPLLPLCNFGTRLSALKEIPSPSFPFFPAFGTSILCANFPVIDFILYSVHVTFSVRPLSFRLSSVDRMWDSTMFLEVINITSVNVEFLYECLFSGFSCTHS